MAVLPIGISGEEGGYQIERSLRFNSSDSAYMSRTPASAGNRKTWTFSAWVKRGALGTNPRTLFSAGTDTSSPRGLIDFNDSNTIRFGFNDGTSWYIAETTAVFRDPSAWYHIVVKCDLTNATQSNRAAIYVNGVQQTTNSVSWPNADQVFNNNVFHGIGRNQSNGTYYGDGYLADVHFIDGSALDPTSFGEYNSDTGVWQPIAYTGSYGTNGFYLDFADNSSTTALGYDAAGSNDWTPNNFSVTAGAGNDSLVDTPTPYGTDTGVGAEVRGNYATLNPITTILGSSTLSDGNLKAAVGSNSWWTRLGTMSVTTGKWYFEYTAVGSGTVDQVVGWATSNYVSTASEQGNYQFSLYATSGGNGQTITNASYNNLGSSWFYTFGDTVMIAFDADANKIWFGKNGSWFGSGNPAAGTNEAGGFSSASYITQYGATPIVHGYWAASTPVLNFGQRPFAYTAPSGFKALCTQNLPEPTIADGGEYFNAVTYTGTGSAQSITGVGFQPDLVWLKARSNAYTHVLVDSIRGTDKVLVSASTGAENTTNSGEDFTAFNSDGFSVGTPVNFNSTNANGATIVGWNWKANGAGVSNTAGSITSTVSANTTAGFSIVTWTGNGSASATVGHSLNATPGMVIAKERTGTDYWHVWHQSLPNQQLYLNVTNAAVSITSGAPGPTDGGLENMTTSTFGFKTSSGGNVNSVNESGILNVAYCFAPVAGYSAFGSYTGNGSSDGPFVYTGFRPKFVLIKCSSAGSTNWVMLDVERTTYNVGSGEYLLANDSGAEGTGINVDILSNGFKLRNTGSWANSSGATYIYAAFAETPFSLSLAR